MKHIILFALLLMAARDASGQNLSEDESGISTVLLPVGNISFNTTKTQLRIGYVKGAPVIAPLLRQSVTTNDRPLQLTAWDSARLKNRWILGGYLSGSNDDGAVTLFNEQRFTAGSGIDLFAGLRMNSSETNLYKTYRIFNDSTDNRQKRLKIIDSLQEDAIWHIQAVLFILQQNAKTSTDWASGELLTIKSIEKQFADKSTPDLILMAIDDAIKLNSHKRDSISKITPEATALKSIREIHAHLEQAHSTYTHITAQLLVLNVNARARRENIQTLKQNSNTSHSMFYLRYTFNKRDFKQLTTDKSSPDSLYRDSTFAGNGLFLNYNLFLPQPKIALGAAIGYEMTDNYDTLQKIKIQTATVIYTDSVRTDKKSDEINVVKGNYLLYSQVPLMVDFLWLTQSEDKKTGLGLGLYFRYNIITNKNAEIKIADNWKAGATINIFKAENARFTGGGYFQIANSTDSQFKHKTFREMVTIGLTTKINLISFDLDNMLKN